MLESEDKLTIFVRELFERYPGVTRIDVEDVAEKWDAGWFGDGFRHRAVVCLNCGEINVQERGGQHLFICALHERIFSLLGPLLVLSIGATQSGDTPIVDLDLNHAGIILVRRTFSRSICASADFGKCSSHGYTDYP